MHRIDTPDADVGNLFQDDESVGTRVTADWLNDVQENLAKLIEGAGIALVKGDHTQLLEAIQNLAFRPGDYKDSAAAADQPGWYFCDNRQVTIAGDPALYAVIGDTFGAADPGYFRIPPGGLYKRALDNGNGNDPENPAIGDIYTDRNQAHSHSAGYVDPQGRSDAGSDMVIPVNVIGGSAFTTGSSGGADARPRTLITQLLIKR